MKKGIYFSNAYGDNAEESIKAIANAGFDNLMTEYLQSEKMGELCDIASRYGLYFEQMHAPFKHINSMWRDEVLGDEVCQNIKDSITVCAEFSIPYNVIHLSGGDNAPHVNDIGIARFKSIVEHAESKNVTVAFENQRKIGNLAFFLELYDKCPNVGFCWDNGHESCFTPGREYMPLFGHKLVCTHIHDNMGVYDQDLHLLPFEGSFNFERYGELIKKSGYQGTLNLELNKRRKDGRYDELSVEEFLGKAYKALEKIEKYCI